MKSFGLWLMSVTLLGFCLGCGETEEPANEPAEPPTNGADDAADHTPLQPPAESETP